MVVEEFKAPIDRMGFFVIYSLDSSEDFL